MDIYNIVEAKLKAKGIKNGLGQGASEISQKVDAYLNKEVTAYINLNKADFANLEPKSQLGKRMQEEMRMKQLFGMGMMKRK